MNLPPPAADLPASPTAPPGHTFTLYAVGGRLYASNVRDKLVDLGTLDRGDGGYRYRLDGDDRAAASGFDTAEDALADVAGTVTFLYLDGQFTALADAGGAARPDLEDATRIHVTLDPKGRAEHAISADL